MIDLIISATVGAIAGSAIMRRIDLRKMADLQVQRVILRDMRVAELAGLADEALKASADEAKTAHACAIDRGNTLQARIDRALACETPKAAHGVKKMAAILRGER